MDTYFVTWPGAMEDAPSLLLEAGELSSHLDSEPTVGLWASHVQGGRLPETAFCFVFVFPGLSFYVCLCVRYHVCTFCPHIEIFSLIPRMGQAQSILLGLVLNHFKDFR